jgi:hypothetical protein
MARELGHVFSQVSIDLATSSGTIACRMATDHVASIVDASVYRVLAETDALVCLAGCAAEEAWFHHILVEHDDLSRARALLERIESNPRVLDAWIAYLRQRATMILTAPSVWQVVDALADALQQVPVWDGPAIDRLEAMPAIERATRYCGEVPQPLPGTPPAMMRDLGDELTISPAALATLEAVGVTTIWHLIHCSAFDLTSLRFLGQKTMDKINQQLAARGWSIGMTVVPEEES